MDVALNSVTNVPYTHDYVNKLLMNPVVILIVVAVVIIYYVVFAGLGVSRGSPTGAEGSRGIKWLEILLWGLFVLLLLLNGMSYFFNFDVTASLHNLFSPTPRLDVAVDTDGTAYAEGDSPEITGTDIVPEIRDEEQVYHLPHNRYTYENAKAICRAYGNRLATIEELQAAYANGADWCSYGWSDGQMALYPTQTPKWKELQQIKGHEHDCGRPGINGGYIANPEVRFGVNCYGYKPEITSREADIMANARAFPITEKEIDFNRRVNYWKSQLPKLLVSPFNNDMWSE